MPHNRAQHCVREGCGARGPNDAPQSAAKQHGGLSCPATLCTPRPQTIASAWRSARRKRPRNPAGKFKEIRKSKESLSARPPALEKWRKAAAPGPGIRVTADQVSPCGASRRSRGRVSLISRRAAPRRAAPARSPSRQRSAGPHGGPARRSTQPPG